MMQRIFFAAMCVILLGGVSLEASEEPTEKMQKLALKKAEYEEAFNDPKTDQLFKSIIGIVAIDTLCSSKLPRKSFERSSYQPSSVKLLSSWLEKSISTVLGCDSRHVACGEATLKRLSTADHDSQGLPRLKHWCALLVQEYPKASRPEKLSCEALTDDLLSRLAAQTGEPTEYEKEILGSKDIVNTVDMRWEICEQIRRWIGSSCALSMAQRAEKTYEYEPDDTLIEEADPLKDTDLSLFQAGCAARALYNQLGFAAYTATCDMRVAGCEQGEMPSSLQQHIESYLYDSYRMIHQLHSVKTKFPYGDFMKTDFLLVGNEQFRSFVSVDGKLMESKFLGARFENTLDTYIREHIPQAVPYILRKIEGGPERFYVEADADNGTRLSGCYRMQGEKSFSHQYVSSEFEIRSIASNFLNNRWAIVNGAHGKLGLYRMAAMDTCLMGMNRRVDFLSTNDLGDRLLGVIKGGSDAYTRLWSVRYDENPKKMMEYVEPFTYELSSPVITLGHSNVGAVGGYTEKGALMVAAFSMDKKLTQDHWVRVDLPGKLTKLNFSRNDCTLFFTVHDEDEKKRSVDQYYMMQHMWGPKKRSVVPCKIPRLKEPLTPQDSCISALDPYGEYIGAVWDRQGSKCSQVVPTEYHMSTNLIRRFKGYRFTDRYALYLLYTVIQESSGHAHISPRQFSGYKALGIGNHILYRSRLRLTAPKGKLQLETLGGKIISRESLSGIRAALYAERNIGS